MERGRGFRRAGEGAIDQLAMPPRDRGRLRLAWGWRQVAGDELARRVRADGVHRGVLDLVVEETRWRDSLAPLLGRLAARLAVTSPALGIMRWRVRLEGDRAGGAQPLPPVADPGGSGETAAGLPRIGGAAAASASSPEPASVRLERAASRYLDRSSR